MNSRNQNQRWRGEGFFGVHALKISDSLHNELVGILQHSKVSGDQYEKFIDVVDDACNMFRATKILREKTQKSRVNSDLTNFLKLINDALHLYRSSTEDSISHRDVMGHDTGQVLEQLIDPCSSKQQELAGYVTAPSRPERRGLVMALDQSLGSLFDLPAKTGENGVFCAVVSCCIKHLENRHEYSSNSLVANYLKLKQKGEVVWIHPIYGSYPTTTESH